MQNRCLESNTKTEKKHAAQKLGNLHIGESNTQISLGAASLTSLFFLCPDQISIPISNIW